MRSPPQTLMAGYAATFQEGVDVADDPPTLLLDEADTVWSKQKTGAAEDLRALINTGVT